MLQNSALKIDKPWGYEVILEKNSHYTVKIIEIYPGQRLSKQFHRHKVESVYVVDGYLRLFKQLWCGGSFIHIPPGKVHRFEAGPAMAVKLIEISHGTDKDIVRLEDDYGRCLRGKIAAKDLHQAQRSTDKKAVRKRARAKRNRR